RTPYSEPAPEQKACLQSRDPPPRPSAHPQSPLEERKRLRPSRLRLPRPIALAVTRSKPVRRPRIHAERIPLLQRRKPRSDAPVLARRDAFVVRTVDQQQLAAQSVRFVEDRLEEPRLIRRDPAAVEGCRRSDLLAERRRAEVREPPAHAKADASDGAALHLALPVEKRDRRAHVVEHPLVGQRLQ